MAAANGRENSGVSQRLFQEPYRFNFFQAVRLLERERHRQVGGDTAPELEGVRFRTLPSLSFPAATISQLRAPLQKSTHGEPAPIPEMTVAFLGLTGPSGVLPHHYTALLIRRLRDKDSSLRDFLDVFNHRLVSHFYRAWKKYHLPAAYEQTCRDAETVETDLGTQALYSLVGLGTPGLRCRQDIDHEAILYYGGHFAHYPRTAVSLECILGDYFEVPIRVQQAQGHWLSLDAEDHAVLPGSLHRRGRNEQLGVNVVVGERVWDVQSTFRLRVGPLTYCRFRQFLPDRGGLRPLGQLTRSYAGPEFRFDVQLVLRAEEVPVCRLGCPGEDGPYLGWNTWLPDSAPRRELEDAVFDFDAS
jgi:type VI secretion system protein ImpH